MTEHPFNAAEYVHVLLAATMLVAWEVVYDRVAGALSATLPREADRAFMLEVEVYGSTLHEALRILAKRGHARYLPGAKGTLRGWVRTL